MRSWQWLLMAVAFHLSAASAALALAGGDPSDLDSCYSKCGDEAGAGGLRCSCDVACEARGDCCADRHEWCAPVAVRPICGLVNDSRQYSRICGTDLGFMFEHEGKLEILFGDTWHYPSDTATSCSDPGLLGVRGVFNDDAQATFATGLRAPSWLPPSAAAARPDGSNCPSLLEFDRSAPSAPYTFTPITLRDLSGKDLSLGLSDTPTAAFSDGKTAFALFGRGGIDDRRAYVARRDATTRTLYHAVAELGHETNFHNPSAARVTSETDYTTPTGSAASVLYLWGRPRFSSSQAETTASNGIVLSKIQLPFYDPATGKSRWAPQFFAGLEPGTQRPRWVQSEAEAVRLVSEDFKRVNQLDVKWVAELGKWVMLYGGDVADGLAPPATQDQPRHGAIHLRMADHPWGPWSRPTPLLWREHVPWWMQCHAYDDTQPIGCDRKLPTKPHYATGDWEPEQTDYFFGASCRKSHPKPAAMPNVNFPFPICTVMSQRGNLYAANIVPTWTRRGAVDPTTGMATTTIYFVVSTWYPYDVVLAAADLTLPVR